MTRHIFSPSRMVGAVTLLATLTCLLAFAPRQMAVAQSNPLLSYRRTPAHKPRQASVFCLRWRMHRVYMVYLSRWRM
jgi:hypothetical protein